MRYAMIVFLVVLATACKRGPKPANEVIAVERQQLPASPAEAAWDQTPEHRAALLPQDQVEPRLLTPTTGEVKVRALANGAEIAIRLEWNDDSKSDTPGPARMVDACAIQVPATAGKDLPEPQMGQEGRPVQVTYWRADWQAVVDGRGDTIRDLYPNASIDHYPHEAKSLAPGSDAQKEMALRYSPARALGNIRGGPRTVPVEDLIAAGPGTLSPGPSLGANGKGTHQKDHWSVVIRRKLPDGLSLNQRTHIAFAVWQGSRGETGARKMRTGWIPLVRRSGS